MPDAAPKPTRSSEIVWRADETRASATVTARFMRAEGIGTYQDLVERSLSDPDWFWDATVRFLEIPFQRPYGVVADRSRGPQWTTWFPDGSLNLSEVCVDRWAARVPDRPAVISENERGEISRLTFRQLQDRVGRTAAVLADLGVDRGDRVVVFLPLGQAAVVFMLAIARIGAIFVPVFSGFGPEAFASRLTSARPVLVVVGDGVERRGRMVPMKATADAALELTEIAPKVLVVRTAPAPDPDLPWTDSRDSWFEQLVDAAVPIPAVETNTEDPVLLTYTSGTTGPPKGIVHVHGGLTVKIVQEGAFQLDIQPGDRHLWLTDMGWVMGQWTVIAGLGNGATVVTYDGSPDNPDAGRVWDLVERHRITALGLSPTFVRSIQGQGEEFPHRHDLSSLRCFGSTGEPWNPDPWWWLFRAVGGDRVPIVNISGGTEIGACLLSVNLLQGIKPTSLGGPALGVPVDVFDQHGHPVRGSVGELVVRDSWPGITRGFWQDRDRYLATYWSRWDDIWVHGDWATVDDDGFWYLHGRSDETLNVGGKRLGPAEVESIVVAHPSVVMASAIGVPDEIKGEAVVVFVVLDDPTAADDLLADILADHVADHLGKPFRPKAIRFVEDLPRTRSAKIMRRVIKARALGKDPGDLSSLENPDSVAAIGKL